MKKGIALLSDIMWFLVFVIIATMLFFFLYKDLHNKLENKITTDGLNGDETYIALSLPRMQHQGKSVATLIQDVAKIQDEDEREQSQAFKDYEKFLNDTMPGLFTHYDWQAGDKEATKPVRYAVLLKSGDTTLFNICKEYVRTGKQPRLCNQMEHATALAVIAASLSTVTNGASLGLVAGNYGYGVAFLPGKEELITITVIGEYEP